MSEPKKERNPYAGQLIKNRYLADEFILAKGGIGFVFKAKDREKNRNVAVKVLQRQLVEDPWIVAKFYSEAKAIMRIHQMQDSLGQEKYTQEEKCCLGWIVEGIETDELEDGSPYLVMEFIEGFSLRNVIRENTHGVNLERAANILKQLGIALSLVHRNGIYHRDLKPENIMLTIYKNGEENIKLIDFGIATVKESPSEKTQTTTLPAGTMAYMAQEQIMAKPSASSDIYAMGVIAYELITGRRPFYLDQSDDGLPAVKFYNAQADGLKIKPKTLRDFLPEEASELIVKALSFNPEDRFSSAEEFGNLLHQALMQPDGEETLISPIKTGKITPKEKTDPAHPIKTKPSLKTQLNSNISSKLTVIGFLLATIIFVATSLWLSKPTSPIVKIGYAIELQRFSSGKYEKTVRLAGRTSFSSNDRIKFNISSQESGYIYLLNESPTKLQGKLPKYILLYPKVDENNYFPFNQLITIPASPESWLQFADATGIEKIWIIWSKEPLLELENIRPLLNSNDKGLVKDIEKINLITKLLEKYNKNLKPQENEQTNLVEITSPEKTIAIAASLIHQ